MLSCERWTGRQTDESLLLPRHVWRPCKLLQEALQLEAAAESKKRPRPGKKLAPSFPLPSPSGPKCFDSPDSSLDQPFVFAAGGNSQLLYLYDDHNGLDFLVDTGAAISLLPHQSVQTCEPAAFAKQMVQLFLRGGGEILN